MSLDLFLKVFALVMFVLATIGTPEHKYFHYTPAGLAALTWIITFA